MENAITIVAAGFIQVTKHSVLGIDKNQAFRVIGNNLGAYVVQ